MKKTATLILLLFIVFQVHSQETKTTNKNRIDWISFEEAIELNKKNPKPFLISIYTTWCGWCKRMDAVTYTNNIIVKHINENFYPIKLDGEQKEDIVYNDYTFKYRASGRRGYNEFAAALLNGKLSYPTTIFMNDKIELLDRIPGYLEPKKMEQIVTFFASKKYKTDTWQDYVKTFKSSL